MMFLKIICWVWLLELACLAGIHDNIYLLYVAIYLSYIVTMTFYPVFKPKDTNT